MKNNIDGHSQIVQDTSEPDSKQGIRTLLSNFSLKTISKSGLVRVEKETCEALPLSTETVDLRPADR